MASSPCLVINGLESRLQLVLGHHRQVLCSHESDAAGRLMTKLAPAIEWMLQSVDIRPGQLGGIAAVRGPGSFTGVRLVLATAAGLARGAGIPMTGLDYLPILAAGPAALLHGELWIGTYARRGQIYLQGFSCPGGAPIIPARALDLNQAGRIIETRSAPLSLLGSGFRRNTDWLETRRLQDRLLSRVWDHPATGTLLAEALKAEYGHEVPEPSYLRATDAEDNLSAIAAGRGVSEDAARAAIPDFGPSPG